MSSSFFDKEYLKKYDSIIAKDIPTYSELPLLAAAALHPVLQIHSTLLVRVQVMRFLS